MSIHETYYVQNITISGLILTKWPMELAQNEEKFNLSSAISSPILNIAKVVKHTAELQYLLDESRSSLWCWTCFPDLACWLVIMKRTSGRSDFNPRQLPQMRLRSHRQRKVNCLSGGDERRQLDKVVIVDASREIKKRMPPDQEGALKIWYANEELISWWGEMDLHRHIISRNSANCKGIATE